MMFSCIKCGLCCKMLKHIPILSDYDRGDGVCRYLDKNLCSIYNDRPVICNIEKMYFSFFSKKMKINEFLKLNKESCLKIAEYFNDDYLIGKIKQLI